MGRPEVIDLDTPRGAARIHLNKASDPRGMLILGHGGGGGVAARDLQAAAKAAETKNLTVALVEQPYRVAGRRSPPPAHHLDEAWLSIVEQLQPQQPLITGGRSSGARVACRTAAATNAAGVLCLAFPFRPPGKEQTRLDELRAVGVPVLIVQGAHDPFGIPPRGPNRRRVIVNGDHSLKADLDAVSRAVAAWLKLRIA